MVQLGRWQYGRYEMRNEINARIDSSQVSAPVVLSSDTREWTRVTMTGQYDPSLEIMVRSRTVHGKVGYEVVTPFVLADGSAVLVDRGWVPPHPKGPTTTPEAPPAPGGILTITGRVRDSESDSRMELREGRWEARRIAVAEIGSKLPYQLSPVYVLADDEVTDLVPVPSSRENDWLNLGYAIQWWIFAGGAVVAYFWLLRREISPPAKRSRQRDVAQQ